MWTTISIHSRLQKQTSPSMEMAERTLLLQCYRPIDLSCWQPQWNSGDTLQSFPNHSNQGAPRYSRSLSSRGTWKTSHVLNVRALMATFCIKEQVYGKVAGTGLYLWWEGAKGNKAGIIFRRRKSNLTTQIINLKGHFMVPQWTQMLHFTLGKRYF